MCFDSKATKTLSDEILKLLRKSKTVSGNDHWLPIGKVTERDIEMLKHVNDSDLIGYQRIIDVSALKHAMKDHPNLTESDFCLIPLIVECPDIVGQGKNKDSIVYKKVLDETFYYVEYIRSGRKYLAMKTFYKRKKPT